jgi:hypothetical protein
MIGQRRSPMPLSVSQGAEAWISDFVNSTDPRFDGKSKAKRRQMALGAYYGAKRKKESMAIFQKAQLLLDLDNTPNQDKRDLNNPDNPYTQNRTTSPQSRYVTGGTSPSSMSTQATSVNSPPLDTSGSLSPTTTALPSSMSSRTGDLMGAQGALAPSPTDLNTSSSYVTGDTPKNLSNVAKASTKLSTNSLFGDVLDRIVELSSHKSHKSR